MTRPRRAALLLLVSTLSAGVTAPRRALADPPQASSDPCRARQPNDPCEAEDFEGICRRRRCTRETDDGVRSFHCLVCESRHHHGHHRSEDGHHRHRDDDASVTDDDAPEVAPVDAATPTDAAMPVTDAVVPVSPRVAPRAPAAPRHRGLFSCAAHPGATSHGTAGLWALAGCGALRRRRSEREGASAP